MAADFDFNSDVSRVPGWLTRSEGTSLFMAARGIRPHLAIVEIGSFKGRSTICLAAGSRAGQGARIVAIDPHHGNPEHQRQFGPIDTYADFLGNVRTAGVADLVCGVRDDSLRVASQFTRPVGFLFVDGNHSFSAVRADLRHWLPNVVHGGVIGVHDSWQIWGPHIVTAWALLTSKRIRRPRLVDTITYFEKTYANTMLERWQNRAFVLLRVVWGFKGFVRLKLNGSVVERRPRVRTAPARA